MELFTPAWKSENEEKTLDAVEKITGQKKLAQVAKEAEYWNVRKAAVAKLTDQNVLADIAKNDSDSDYRSTVSFADNDSKQIVANVFGSNTYMGELVIWSGVL